MLRQLATYTQGLEDTEMILMCKEHIILWITFQDKLQMFRFFRDDPRAPGAGNLHSRVGGFCRAQHTGPF
jgi:hypothetical protein